jgi:hypothetical protein
VFTHRRYGYSRIPFCCEVGFEDSGPLPWCWGRSVDVYSVHAMGRTEKFKWICVKRTHPLIVRLSRLRE